MRARLSTALLSLCIAAGVAHPAAAFRIEIASGDFAVRNNVFSNVTGFQISIEVLEPLQPGSYDDPQLGDIEFLVEGGLDPTTPARTANPSFTGFAVDDLPSLSGQDFYDLGNSLHFEILETAILTDGLQVAELAGAGIVFEFDGRELGTGRYHPPILQLSSDGTGSIRNAANTGGINPFTGVEVNATIGDEYITELGFDPTQLTLAVPEPSAGLLLGLGLAALAGRRPARERRARRAAWLVSFARLRLAARRPTLESAS